jgi:preprotein translocase subunit SecA
MQAHHLDPFTGHDEAAEAALALGRPQFGRAGGVDVGMGGMGLGNGPTREARPPANPNDPSTWGKVGRNESCPCGSGKKFKHCHGALV